MADRRLAVSLALADARHELRLSLATVIGIAAILAPLIVLAGLKSGIVTAIREGLTESPRAREVVNIANRSFDDAFFAAMRARPDVAFIVPRTRTLAASGGFARDEASDAPIRAELLATAAGDPLLAGLPTPEGRAAVLSDALAQRLGAKPGETLRMRIDRVFGGQRQTLALSVTVAAVAPPSAFGREAAFLPLPLLLLAEDFQDGTVGPDAPQADAPVPPGRVYAGFRLYARALEDVVAIDRALRSAGIDVATRAEDVAALLALDRNLATLFAAIASLGGAGYLIGLAVGLYANVERKRRDLALLRLMGLSAQGLVVFPAAQAAVFAAAGTVLAAAVALALQGFVNRLELAVAEGRAVSAIGAGDLAFAAAATLAGALGAAAFAARRAAAIAPGEGMRDA
ncbi:MAG: ABC transporter permease [Rubritepida sp.]|jgi:putative ABC transport system permease protein|nr:ABC transporter permease [Rubritepida sp.]